MSWNSEEYQDDSFEEEIPETLVEIKDTDNLIDQAEDIVERLRTYAFSNGLGFLTSDNSVSSMVTLIEMSL